MRLPNGANWKTDDDASLAARAAWLYFAGGKTQSEGADRLNVPSTKAHRLIAPASRGGLIRVLGEGAAAEGAGHEEARKAAYGAEFWGAAPDLDEGPLP